MSSIFALQGHRTYPKDITLDPKDNWTRANIANVKTNLFDILNKEIINNKVLPSNVMLFFGIPCTYFTQLNKCNGMTRTRQSESEKIGVGGVWGVDQRRTGKKQQGVTRVDEQDANWQLQTMIEMIHDVVQMYPGVKWGFENGASTYLWDAILDLQKYQWGPSLHINICPALIFHCCRFGCAWLKPTRLATNCTALQREFGRVGSSKSSSSSSSSSIGAEMVYKWSCKCVGRGKRHVSICGMKGRKTSSTSSYAVNFCKLFVECVLKK